MIMNKKANPGALTTRGDVQSKEKKKVGNKFDTIKKLYLNPRKNIQGVR